MANNGVLGGGGYQGRYLEFAWMLVSQDIGSNTSTIYWRVTVVGGSSSYYYHYRDYCDAFGDVLVNSNSRTKRYKGDLANGYKIIQHDGNGNAVFSAHVIAAIYTSGVNEDLSTSWALPSIPRQANITNLPGTFNDEENPWFDYSNPGNFNLEAWLEPNPNGPHIAVRTLSGTNGRYTWNLTEDERNQLRRECKGNSCTIRIGLYSNNKTWASYHDRTFVIKNPNPLWNDGKELITVDNGNLAGNDVIIKGYSKINFTGLTATAVKQATIKEYRLMCGGTVARNSINEFTIDRATSNTFINYVEDSRSNIIAKEYTISNFIDYFEPIILEFYVSRDKGGIGQNVIIEAKGKFWNGNFGTAENVLEIQYFYKIQGALDWIQGSTKIEYVADGDNFTVLAEIAGDLEANGFDIGNNYDIKINVIDKIASVSKEQILPRGVPQMAFGKNGVNFGGFYDEDAGSPLQIGGIPAYRFLKTKLLMVSGTVVLTANNQNAMIIHSKKGILDMFKNKYGVTLSNDAVDIMDILVGYTNGDPAATWTSITGSYVNGTGEFIVGFNNKITGRIRVNYQYIINVDLYDDRNKWDNNVLNESR